MLCLIVLFSLLFVVAEVVAVCSPRGLREGGRLGWLKVQKRFVGSSGAQKRSAQAPRIKARGEAPRLPNRFPRLGAARCPAIAGLGSQAGTHRYGRSDELQDQAHRPGDLQHCALGSVQPIKAKPKVYPEACLDHWRAIPVGLPTRACKFETRSHCNTRNTLACPRHPPHPWKDGCNRLPMASAIGASHHPCTVARAAELQEGHQQAQHLPKEDRRLGCVLLLINI